MLGQAGDAGEQQRAAGDGFPARLGMGQSHVPAPPVVDQGHGPCREIAAFQVVGGVATPAPLVDQLIKAVFAIGTIAVELADGVERMVGVGHQHRVLPDFGVAWSVGEQQGLLA